MYSIKQVESGLLKYIDKELMPQLTQTGEAILANLCHNRAAQMLGVASADGGINIDMMRNVAQTFVGDNGLTFTVMGVDIRFTKDDIDTLYKMIKES